VFAIFIYATSFISDWKTYLVLWKVLNIFLVLSIATIIYLIIRRSIRIKLAAVLGYLLINALPNSGISIGYYFDQYDYIPIGLMMASLYLVQKNKIVGSAILCGIGMMTKIFPVVVLLASMATLGTSKKPRYFFCFAITCLLIALPWLLTNTETLKSFYYFTASRQPWETIWCFPKIQFPPVPRPASLVFPFSSSDRPYSWLFWTSAISILGLLLWRWRIDKRRLAEMAFSVLILLMIFSKGISCYFIFWTFPLLFVTYRPSIAFSVCAILMLIGNLEFAGGLVKPSTYWLVMFGRHTVLLALLIHLLAGSRNWLKLSPKYPAGDSALARSWFSRLADLLSCDKSVT
jgi:4-amino-4-deoxy-L-arabinose transferase-like glycosyltransferase